MNAELIYYYKDELRANVNAALFALTPFITAPIMIGLLDSGHEMKKTLIIFYAISFTAIALVVIYGWARFKKNFREFNFLLAETTPVESRVTFVYEDVDGSTAYYRADFPLLETARLKLDGKEILMRVPPWDMNELKGELTEAELFLDSRTNKCRMIRTKLGLLIQRK